MNNSDSDSDPEGEHDTRHGTPSPTRDTRQSEPHYEQSSSEDEGEERDKNGDDSPFRDDEDSPTNQSPTDLDEEDEEDEDLVSTEKRRLRQIATEQDSEERARLLEELNDMISERRERSEADW